MSATELSPLSSGVSGSARGSVGHEVRRVRARPPRGFRPFYGVPSNVRFGGTVPENVGRTRAQRAGLAFEQKVHDVLSAIYGEHYRPHPAVLYHDRRGLRRAIPDGLLSLPGTTVVIEVKLTHTDRAWWQLARLYIPLLRHLAGRDVRLVGAEICFNFDPDTKWPEPFQVISSLHSLTSGLGVLQWRL